MTRLLFLGPVKAGEASSYGINKWDLLHPYGALRPVCKERVASLFDAPPACQQCAIMDRHASVHHYLLCMQICGVYCTPLQIVLCNSKLGLSGHWSERFEVSHNWLLFVHYPSHSASYSPKQPLASP